MSSRTFTLDEAQDLLPVLESLLRKALDGKKLIESVDAELQAVAHRIFMNGGMSVNVVHLASRKAEGEKTFQRVKDAMDEIGGIGGQVKNSKIGFLDFPWQVECQSELVFVKL